MATLAGDGVQTPANSKWKPGGRGRPPKSPPQLPGKVGGVGGGVPGTTYQPHDDNEIPPELETKQEQPAAQSEYDLRRNPDTYPRFPNSDLPIPLYRVTRTEDDLANYLSAMRPQDWSHCELYVYQKYPMHVKIPGVNQYVDKVTEGPVNFDTFIRQFGSGKYSFTLNDSNIQGNRRTVMYASMVDLSRDEYPEKYVLENLDVTHANNRNLVARLQREGILDKRGEPVADTQNTYTAQTVQQLTSAVIDMAKNNARAPIDPNATQAAAINHATIQMMGDASKAAIAAVSANAKGGGVAETLQLVSALKDMVAPAKPTGPDPMMTLMLEELKSQREDAKRRDEREREENRRRDERDEAERKRQHEIQMAQFNKKEEAQSPLNIIKSVLEMKNLISGGDAGSMAPRNWKEQGIQMLGENLPNILQLGTAMFTSVGKPGEVDANAAVAAGQNNGQQLQPAGNGQPQPAPHGQTQPQPTAQPNPGEPLTQEQQVAAGRIRALQTQIADQGRFLVQAIKKGQDGYKFAELLIDMTDELTYERARSYSVGEWMYAIFSFPQLQKEFAGAEAIVERFVTEFIEFGNEDDENENENGVPGNPGGQTLETTASQVEEPPAQPPAAKPRAARKHAAKPAA